jgi:cyclic pyranopterin phosphate synthase
MMDLTHFDEAGRARMVDVGGKADTAREAVATGVVRMLPATLARIREGRVAKGDVLAVAQVAGIMAAKRTPEIIPLCHTLLLTGVDLAFELEEDSAAGEGRVHIRATVRTVGKTGAEMEALTAVSATALTIYDMCKAVDREMSIDGICLLRKSGGKSGTFERGAPA